MTWSPLTVIDMLFFRGRMIGLDTPLVEQLITDQASSKRHVEPVADSEPCEREPAALESQVSTAECRNKVQDVLVPHSSCKRSTQAATSGHAR